MQGAFDGAVGSLHETIGQQRERMGADAAGRADLVAETIQRNGRGADLDTDHLAVAQRIERRHLLPGHAESFESHTSVLSAYRISPASQSLVSRFRRSYHFAARTFTNVGSKGTLATL